MKVLLSAYACEPGRGSEPGVGWKWTLGMASRVELHVLTRETNRQAIESEINNLPAGHPLRKVSFHYHDLGGIAMRAKRWKLLPTMAYYILWQRSAARRFADTADACDIVHHLTFCTLLCPGFWKLSKAAYVLGPVGAPQVNPHYLALFGGRAWLQVVRAWLMEHFLDLPWLRRLLHDAAAVVPANSETRAFLQSHGVRTENIILDTGAPDLEQASTGISPDNTVGFMYAGQLERRKGLELSLKALAHARKAGLNPWRFDIFGNGPDRRRLEKLARNLEIADHVFFHGAVPQSELHKRFQEADAFLFTSVRDTSGGVNLEAMAHGLPVICIAHQGVGDVTDDTCAERVAPGPIADTIDALSSAIRRLASDPAKMKSMGLAAATRAAGFSWSGKFDAMCMHYQNATGSRTEI